MMSSLASSFGSPRRQSALAAALLALFAIGAGPDRPQAVWAVKDREARQPQVTIGADGRVYLAFGAGNEVRVASSDDGGRSFSEPVPVGSPGMLALGMRRGPRIAVGQGAVVISAIGGAGGGPYGGLSAGDLWSWRSTDGGTTWSEPIRLNQVEGSAREGLHAMAAGPEGQIACVWTDLRDNRAHIRGVISTDGGATWGPEVLIHQSPEGPICPCCHPSVAFGPDGTLYVMWRDAISGARDMYLCRSLDGGKTFELARKLGEGTWPLEVCPMDGGAIAAGPDGQATTVWMRDGRLYSAEPGHPERLLGPGVQGWAAWGPEGPFLAWLDRRPGQLLALRPGDAEPIVLFRSANDPSIASSINGRGPVVAAWEAGPGGSGIFVARLDRTGSGE
ncbi:sialidase family protein [Tautonia marina]|uniref:sialidase family protein n=1 Tax=Tautonia marina TaxID=2653855 RepID=UPI001260611A|nr:sialidase family protein [Tautonia marina]